MTDETRLLPPDDPDRCPQCAAPLVRLTGDGALETYCAVCGFAVRQSAPRRAEGADLVQVRPAPAEPDAPPVIVRATVWTNRRRPRLLWFPRSWIARTPLLLLLALALRTQYHGYPDFETVLFGQLYVYFFCAIVIFMPLFVRQADGPLPSTSVFVQLPGALAAGWWAAGLAPVIGEANYCGTHYTSSVAWVTPPHIFRCTSTPFTIAGFIAGWWAVGWLLERWMEWRDSRA